MSHSLFQATKIKEFCPQCGAELHIRQGKCGRFLGCSAYPNCDYLKPLQTHTGLKILKTLPSPCPDCGEALQLKQGSFGMFIGCSNYPDCHYRVSHQEEQKAVCPCPNCSGELLERLGKNGKAFWGCTNYPQCKTTVSVKPEAKTCNACGFGWASLKKTTKAEICYQCVKCQAITKVLKEEDNESK